MEQDATLSLGRWASAALNIQFQALEWPLTLPILVSCRHASYLVMEAKMPEKTKTKQDLEKNDLERFVSEGGHDPAAAKVQAKREEEFVKTHKKSPKARKV